MIRSVKPGKQRLLRKKAPMHVRRKMMSSRLSKDLRKKYKRSSIPIRKGDEVIIMRGSFKGVKGKVELVKRKAYRVIVENAFIEKKNGTKVKVPFDASKLMITGLAAGSDKRLGGSKA